MTKDEAIHALVQRAYGEVGYHESGNNYTKYSEDPRITKLYGWNVQNQPWCNTFVNWLFINTFGYDDGVAMTYGGSARCFTHAQLYKNNGAWSTEPHKGDQIFFSSGDGHTGVVVDVSASTVTTVEGNYTDRVACNTHFINDPDIMGYGKPNWSVVANEPNPDPEDDSDIVHPLHPRTYFHLEYGDGLVTKEHPNTKPSPQVKAWQALLNLWDNNLKVDGEFGALTLTATKKWQQKVKGIGGDVEVNGIVDEDDWKEIIYVEVN